MSKKALITGIRGQDGAYLAKSLLEDGYDVYGADRRSGDATYWRLRSLGINNEVRKIYMDLLELSNVLHVIEKIKPDEVYNLAAQSFVATSFDQPILTSDVNAIGTLRLLESLRRVNPDVKFYQASTSEMFGKVRETPQTEETPFYPRSPYGVAKLYAHWMTINYREAYNMFACSGILFNHESPLRGEEFVTRKITKGIAAIQAGVQKKIILGNLDAKRDWGYAGDYVEGMKMMLRHDVPDDYILATGETHSIREFVERAFSCIGINIIWEGAGVGEKGHNAKTGDVLVEVSADFFRPSEVELLQGDSSKVREVLGWCPTTTFEKLIEMMVEHDLQCLNY